MALDAVLWAPCVLMWAQRPSGSLLLCNLLAQTQLQRQCCCRCLHGSCCMHVCLHNSTASRLTALIWIAAAAPVPMQWGGLQEHASKHGKQVKAAALHCISPSSLSTPAQAWAQHVETRRSAHPLKRLNAANATAAAPAAPSASTATGGPAAADFAFVGAPGSTPITCCCCCCCWEAGVSAALARGNSRLPLATSAGLGHAGVAAACELARSHRCERSICDDLPAAVAGSNLRVLSGLGAFVKDV